MTSKVLSKMNSGILRMVLVTGLLAILILGLTMCAQPTEEPAEAPAEEAAAPAEDMEEELAEEEMEEETGDEEPAEAADGSVLAIQHFSVIEGTTWSGAHDRAGLKGIIFIPYPFVHLRGRSPNPFLCQTTSPCCPYPGCYGPMRPHFPSAAFSRHRTAILRRRCSRDRAAP